MSDVIQGSRTVYLSLLTTLLCCQSESSLPHDLKPFNLEEVVPLLNFFPERLSVQWISDTEFIRRELGAGILKFNALSHSFTTILNESELFNLYNYSVTTFSKDGRYALLAANSKKVYRYSFVADYAVYDLQTKDIQPIGQGPLQVVQWSTSKALAYVADNNVYYIPNVAHSHVYVQLTTEGIPGEVYFGATDWIYEEEVFNAAEALWFSPRGTYLAVASFNDTKVESAVYPYYGTASDINNQYPELVKFKYPKAGRINPEVGLRVYRLGDLRNDTLNIPAPVDVVGLDHILGRVDWASDQNLIILWLNRRQSISILVNCNIKEDKCSIVKEHREPNGWIDLNQPFFDRSGTKLVEIQPLYYGDQRFFHAARLDFNTLITEDLSPGNGTVTEILGWDQDKDIVYYIVSPGNSPWNRQIWAAFEGTVRCIYCLESTCHYASATFSPGAKYGIVTCSATNTVPKIMLYDSESVKFYVLRDNANLKDKLKHYKHPMPLFNVISLGDEINAHAKLLLPPEMKANKKYPMILRVYAGPGTARAKDTFEMEFYNMYLTTNRSFIVASIDVRGSGVMGVEAMHAVNTALGTVEITDTLAAIRHLIKLYSFIDPKRIGVWGWSYGGYSTTMMLIKDDQKTLACGAAVAPVTSWLYYDTIYTERYMDTPQENPVGYERSDVLALADNLRGRKYLLVHGTGDDNVHYQHSAQLAKKLQRADIAFDQMTYTDENHSLLEVSRHFYHALDHFWTEISERSSALVNCEPDLEDKGICGVDACEPQLCYPEPRVVIIGAGMAGISAAARLSQKGINNIVVLEAYERPGGRIHSCWFKDIVAELGCHWKQDNSFTHPIYMLSAVEDPPQPGVPGSLYPRGLFNRVVNDRLPYPPTITAYFKFRQIEKEATQIYCYGGYKQQGSFMNFISLRIQQELHEFPEEQQHEAARIMFGLAYMYSARCGEDTALLCADHTGCFMNIPGGVVRVPLGLSAVLAPLLRQIPEGAIRYCKPVNCVYWGTSKKHGRRAIVCTADGEEFSADYVIVTVSVGVLAANANRLFCPALPSSKTDATHLVGCGYCNKVFLEFSRPFWYWYNGDLKFRLSHGSVEGRNDWTRGVTAIEPVPNSKYVLCAWVVGNDAVAMEALCDKDVVEGIMDLLKASTGDNFLPYPCTILRSYWASDPFFCGSYSFDHINSNGKAQRALACPLPGPRDSIPPVLLFAGEATVPGHFATISGARLSGVREAERIVQLTLQHKGPPLPATATKPKKTLTEATN
ncbi:hypothetical protein ACJJTC_012227 [Scirpophaga incertulas]